MTEIGPLDAIFALLDQLDRLIEELRREAHQMAAAATAREAGTGGDDGR